MNFKRKQRIKGKTAKHYKEWYDETKQYRITWRNQVMGVSVKPGYYACVRCLRERGGDFEYWGFAGRRGLYKTRKAAAKECEQNQRVWNAFLAIEGRAKVTQVRNLQARAFVGKGKTSHSIMRDLPLWVLGKASPRLLEILCGNEKDQSDPTETLTDSSDAESVPSSIPGGHDTPDSGPASRATEAEESGTPTTHRARSKATRCETASDAKPAKAPAKARGKRASKRTVKRSTPGKRKRKSTTASKR